MAGVYLDTSAFGRLVLDEADGEAVAQALADADVVISSRLLAVELHRLGLRRGIDAAVIDTWLAGVTLIPVDAATLTAAESVPPTTVATLDAIHLATALALRDRGHATSMLTFDARLADGARQHGLELVTV